MDENKPVQENMQDAVEQAQQEVVETHVPWYRLFRRGTFLIFAYCVLLVVFLIIAVTVHYHSVLTVDIFLTREFQENRAPWLVTFMEAVSYLGNQALLFSLLIVLTAIAFWVVRLRLEALFILGLSVISFPLNGLLKYLVSRPRPTASLVEVWQKASGQSFPSGHVMAYMAFWGLLFSFGLILFQQRRWWQYLLLFIPAFFVVMVGPSRIYLGDHWASDVLGGYLFGGLLLGLALSLYLALQRRGVLASRPHPEEHDRGLRWSE